MSESFRITVIKTEVECPSHKDQCPVLGRAFGSGFRVSAFAIQQYWFNNSVSSLLISYVLGRNYWLTVYCIVSVCWLLSSQGFVGGVACIVFFQFWGSHLGLWKDSAYAFLWWFWACDKWFICNILKYNEKATGDTLYEFRKTREGF